MGQTLCSVLWTCYPQSLQQHYEENGLLSCADEPVQAEREVYLEVEWNSAVQREPDGSAANSRSAPSLALKSPAGCSASLCLRFLNC